MSIVGNCCSEFFGFIDTALKVKPERYGCMAEPGFYKSNYRALSIRELVRWRGVLKLPLAFILTRFVMRPTGGVWMPSLSADLECTIEELPPQFLARTESQRTAIESLGFVPCFYAKLRRNINARMLETGSVTYLHSGGSYMGIIISGTVQTPPPVNRIKEYVHVVFTAVIDDKVESFSNATQRFDLSVEGRSTFVNSNDVGVIYQRFVHCIASRRPATRVFTGCEDLREWLDEMRLKGFEAKVKRGLFVRMTDAEVEQARLRMPS